jgi:hypothetical protein
MEVALCSETSAYNKPIRRHVPEDSILPSHYSENLKSYIVVERFPLLLSIWAFHVQILTWRLDLIT